MVLAPGKSKKKIKLSTHDMHGNTESCTAHQRSLLFNKEQDRQKLLIFCSTGHPSGKKHIGHKEMY